MPAPGGSLTASQTMQTQVLQIDAQSPDPALIAQAAAVLRAGGLAAFPTETVYGLGANALDPAAVARIFAAKGRPANNPLIVHVAETADAAQVVSLWPELAARLAEHFWPGPLTLILPHAAALPDLVTAGGPTVAVRLPAHPVARALIRAAGVPVAAPSANRSSQLSPTRAEHVLDDLHGEVDLILDAGPTPGGLESTVLDVTTSPPRLLRPGLLAPSAIEAIIGSIVRPTPVSRNDQAPRRSPGMMERHYAPRARLECATDSGWARVDVLVREGARVGLLTFDIRPHQQVPGLFVARMPTAPADYAARLYAVLHEMDAAEAERIVVELPPDTEEWLAVRDRLRRASATP